MSAGWRRLMERKSGNINFRFRWLLVRVLECVCACCGEWGTTHVIVPVHSKWNYKLHWCHGVQPQQTPFAGESEQTSFNMLSTAASTLFLYLLRSHTRAQSKTGYRYCYRMVAAWSYALALALTLFTFQCASQSLCGNVCACVRVSVCVFAHTPTSGKVQCGH